MATRVPTRKVAGSRAKPANPLLQGPALTAAATQYLVLRDQKAAVEKQMKKLSDQLKASIEVHGYDETGENGAVHQVYDLPDAFGKITGLKREKRVTQSFNDEKAEGFFRAKKLWIPVDKGGVVETIEVVDQDAVLRLAFEQAITERDLNSLYDENITWALVTVAR